MFPQLFKLLLSPPVPSMIVGVVVTGITLVMFNKEAARGQYLLVVNLSCYIYIHTTVQVVVIVTCAIHNCWSCCHRYVIRGITLVMLNKEI